MPTPLIIFLLFILLLIFIAWSGASDAETANKNYIQQNFNYQQTSFEYVKAIKDVYNQIMKMYQSYGITSLNDNDIEIKINKSYKTAKNYFIYINCDKIIFAINETIGIIGYGCFEPCPIEVHHSLAIIENGKFNLTNPRLDELNKSVFGIDADTEILNDLIATFVGNFETIYKPMIINQMGKYTSKARTENEAIDNFKNLYLTTAH